MYVGKEKLQQVTDAASVDTFVYINDRDKVIMQDLLADFPMDFGVLFIHFATTDDMGEVYGWLSPEQLSVVYRADEALGELLAALDTYGLRDETLLIVTADHGGHGTTHGSSLPEDMTIPWIASGPGIQAGELTPPCTPWILPPQPRTRLACPSPLNGTVCLYWRRLVCLCLRRNNRRGASKSSFLIWRGT